MVTFFWKSMFIKRLKKLSPFWIFPNINLIFHVSWPVEPEYACSVMRQRLSCVTCLEFSSNFKETKSPCLTNGTRQLIMDNGFDFSASKETPGRQNQLNSLPVLSRWSLTLIFVNFWLELTCTLKLITIQANTFFSFDF